MRSCICPVAGKLSRMQEWRGSVIARPRAYDQETENRRVSALFEESQSQNRQTQESGHVQHTRESRAARARRAILQTPLGPGAPPGCAEHAQCRGSTSRGSVRQRSWCVHTRTPVPACFPRHDNRHCNICCRSAPGSCMPGAHISSGQPFRFSPEPGAVAGVRVFEQFEVQRDCGDGPQFETA